MKLLYTADLHLTSKPLDQYRFQAVQWIAKEAKKRRVDEIWILGDLTEEHDRHAGAFVSRVVRALTELAASAPVFIVKGNHDYADPDNPFFKFLSLSDTISFYTEFRHINYEHEHFVVWPHGKQMHEQVAEFDLKHTTLLTHASFQGGVAENGHEMEGIDPKVVAGMRQVWSGHLHVPQEVGKVRYVGSPYPTIFTETPHEHSIVVETFTGPHKSTVEVVPVPSLAKRMLKVSSIDQLQKAALHEGDQVRVELALPRAEFIHWDEHRAAARKVLDASGVVVCGVSVVEKKLRRRLKLGEVPTASTSRTRTEILTDYCKAFSLGDELKEVGLALVKTERS